MIGSEINHCKGKEIKILKSKKQRIKADSDSHLWISTPSKIKFQEWYKPKYAICLHCINDAYLFIMST